MNTIIATFATRAFARQAEEELREAGFEAITIDVDVTAEKVEAASDVAVVTPGIIAPNSTMGGGPPTPVVMPLVAETMEANATARLTLKTNAREAEAVSIINSHGGMLENDRAQNAQSTQEEVANAAQASDRLK